jgi:hypothetical protein
VTGFAVAVSLHDRRGLLSLLSLLSLSAERILARKLDWRRWPDELAGEIQLAADARSHTLTGCGTALDTRTRQLWIYGLMALSATYAASVRQRAAKPCPPGQPQQSRLT